LEFIVLKLRQALIAFAILGSKEYMDVLLAQFAIWEYQSDFQHPVVDIMKGAVDSFIGEDIELLNRLLAQHSKHNARRSDATMANDAYRCLGMMVHDGVEFNDDLLESYKLTKGNRRYELKIDGPEVAHMQTFLEETYEAFRAETWLHYAIPRQGAKKTVGKGKNRRRVEQKMDPDVACSMVLSSAKFGTRDDEIQTRELIAVRFVASVDWLEALKLKFRSLKARRCFSEHLKLEQLEN